MECGQVQTLLNALAESLYQDAEGNVYLNTTTVVKDCDDVPFINCENNHIPPEGLLINAVDDDECGHKAIRIAGCDCEFQELRIGIDPDYSEFDNTGHLTLHGEARPWRDELGDALSLQRSGAGISIDLSESVVNFDFNAAYNANPALADFLYKNVQLNHDRDLTSELHVHIHWFQAKNFSPNFLLEYRWQINGGAKVTNWQKLKCNSLAFTYTIGTIHQISYASAILPPIGTNLSDIIQFRIYRDTSNASGEFTGTCPYNTGGNASAGVLSFDVHFQINSLGSDEEYIK